VTATRVVDLRTSLLDRPLGLHDRQPTFSWRLESEGCEVTQRAYRILVSSSETNLLEGRADLWDTGRVTSCDSVGVQYAGKLLTSRARAHWTVTVWDNQNQESKPAQGSTWEMGLLERSDWIGVWLAAEDELERDDRVAGMAWIGAGNPGANSLVRFRLPFTAASTGRLLLTIASTCQSRIAKLTLDDQAIVVPGVAGFVVGAPPATRFELPITMGSHCLTADLESLAAFPIHSLMSTVGLAAQLRIMGSDGCLTRVSDGWQVQGACCADWASAERLDDHTSTPWPPSPARLMRRRFVAHSAPRSARLYVTALGAFEMRLNGVRVSSDSLTPESTDFGKRVLYSVFDVTSMVAVGENVLGAIVGDGWYASYTVITGRYPFGEAPRRILAQIEITYEDGSRYTVATDEQWRAHRAPILSSEIYNGEEYDARLEQPGWDQTGFDDRHWDPVWSVPDSACTAELIAQPGAAIRAVLTLEPVAFAEPTPGTYVFDFGQNFAGWARLKLQAPSGRRVTLRFAEALKSDGEVNQANLQMALATDVYIARGDPGGETYEPHFTYHGFRYVQVEGLDRPVPKDIIQGIVVHSDLKETGHFRIESPLIRKLWENTLWSQRSNFLGIPTDCPQRSERLGWSGDAQVFWDTAAFNMDVSAFTRRYLNDLRLGQHHINGAYDLWAPKADKNLMPLITATPGWADAGVVLPWTTYMRYGDRSIIDENWEAMTRYVDGILQQNPDYLWRKGRGVDLGDWLSLDAKEPWQETTPKDLIASALLARSCDQLSDMAVATGRAREGVRYQTLAQEVKRAFAHAFVTPRGVVGNGSQSSYVLALRFDCVPKALRQAAGANLISDIRKRGTVLSTGFLGTPFSLDVIADSGDPALVYDLLLKREFPSWGYMIEKGATTIWESWNSGNDESSRNHYALGSVCGFLYRRVAGLDPLEPGFARVRVRPVLDGRVRWVSADYHSVRGRISSHWTLAPNAFDLALTLPANTRAVVHLPASTDAKISVNGRLLEARPPVEIVSGEAAEFVLEVPSGSYRFAVTPLPKRLQG
jgi:alpha-L-rhamnosidase